MRILYKTDQYSQQRQNQKPVWVYPVLMAMEATYQRDLGHKVIWEIDGPKLYEGGYLKDDYDAVVTKPQGLDFLSLPIPDRRWTMAFDKRYQLYGNYKYHPATHMMAASGCWHGRCSFCVENGRPYQVRSMDAVIDEIRQCKALGFKEIFDDSATFPDGSWLQAFCNWKMGEGLADVVFGCNMRIGADADYPRMKRAGFRMVLFGIESANQSTLDRIGKGINAKDIIPTIRRAAEAGLENHVAVMFGQPGEGVAEEQATLELVHFLLRKGWAKTAQASIFRVHGWTGVDRGNVKRIYDVAKYPEFWIRKLGDLRDWHDFIYLMKGVRKGLVHD